MGLLFSSLFGKLFGTKEVRGREWRTWGMGERVPPTPRPRHSPNPHPQVRVLILGLDNAGKTTILFRLQVDEPVTTVVR